MPVLLQYGGQNLFHGIAALPPPPSSSLMTTMGTTTTADNEEDEDQAKQAYRKAMLVGALNMDFATGLLSDGIPPMCTHLVGLREMFLEKLVGCLSYVLLLIPTYLPGGRNWRLC